MAQIHVNRVEIEPTIDKKMLVRPNLQMPNVVVAVTDLPLLGKCPEIHVQARQ